MRAGFTLIEVIIGLAIIGILAAIAIPSYQHIIEKVKVSRAIAEIHGLGKEIKIYEPLPDSLNQIGLGNRVDPWGNPYQYLKIEGVVAKAEMRKDRFMVPVNSDFDLYSMGKDGKSFPGFVVKESWDDIVRACDGAYVGLVSNF